MKKKTNTVAIAPLTRNELWMIGWNKLQEIVDRENARLLAFIKYEHTVKDMAKAVWVICSATNQPSVMLLQHLRAVVLQRLNNGDEAAQRLADGIQHAIPFFARGLTSPDGWGKYLRHDVIFPPAQEAEKAA